MHHAPIQTAWPIVRAKPIKNVRLKPSQSTARCTVLVAGQINRHKAAIGNYGVRSPNIATLSRAPQTVGARSNNRPIFFYQLVQIRQMTSATSLRQRRRPAGRPDNVNIIIHGQRHTHTHTHTRQPVLDSYWKQLSDSLICCHCQLTDSPREMSTVLVLSRYSATVQTPPFNRCSHTRTRPTPGVGTLPSTASNLYTWNVNKGNREAHDFSVGSPYAP